MPFYGKLDIYDMKNRLIRYLWILKLKIKYMPYLRFKELKNGFCPFLLIFDQIKIRGNKIILHFIN